MLLRLFNFSLGPLLIALLIAPLAASPRPAPAAAADSPPAALQQMTILPEINEVEPNGDISPGAIDGDPVNAQLIAAGQTGSWEQPIVGAIARSDDIDYYTFKVEQPGSIVSATLTNLGADYDLVFGGGVNPLSGTGQTSDTFEFDSGERGLDNISEVGGQIASIGGQIASIGGQIASIGGQIASIGGQIASIGGQIASIGGQIASISANPGTRNEQIETVVWQPGIYFVAVAPAGAGEASSTPYQLTISLSSSGLTPLGPAPNVQITIDPDGVDTDVTTLYIINSARMRQVYGASEPNISVIRSTLLNDYTQQSTLVSSQSEAGLVFEKGAVIDLADILTINRAQTLAELYTGWLSPTNQANPLYANYIAGIIDNVIEAAIAPSGSGRSGDVRVNYLLNIDQNQTLTDQAPATPYPNVRNIVLVGSDEIIPFFRLPDFTTIANEADYLEYLKQVDANSGGASIIGEGNPLGAALKNRMLLSDGPFGAERPYRFYGFPLFVPELAVGRIVEQPYEIADFLLRNNPVNSGSQISLRYGDEPSFPGDSYSVTGYDFLLDGADAVSRTLALATQGASPPISRRPLINDAWDRPSFEQQWLEQPLGAPGFFTSPIEVFSRTHTTISSLNAHFDHWQLIPAVDDQSAAPNFPAQRVLDVTYQGGTSCQSFGFDCPGFFGTSLSYSVGCHSGYNVPSGAILSGRAINASLYAADFPQAFNRHGGNWIGNTGYGYGTLDGVDYSERLSALLTQELVRNISVADPLFNNPDNITYIGQSIGEALVKAKQRYLRSSVSLNAYDAKVLAITTLYGLPWMRTFVASPLDAAIEDLNAALPAGDRTAPLPTSGSQLERIITFTLDFGTDFLTDSRTGQLLSLGPQSFTISDSFLLASTFNVTPTVTMLENNQIGRPVLPAFAYDITALSGSDPRSRKPLVVRDVVFLGGQYNSLSGFNPTVTQIVTETNAPLNTTDVEPDFSAGIGVWVPDKFFGYSSVGSGSDQRDQLVSTAAQFRATTGVTGTLRSYSEIVYKVIYTDPEADGADAALADETPPIIERVQVGATSAPQAAPQAVSTPIDVLISDPDNPTSPDVTVTAVYLAADGVTWTPLVFSQDSANLRRWTASVPLEPRSVRVIITAVDGAGNAAVYTAKGSFAVPTYTMRVPIIGR